MGAGLARRHHRDIRAPLRALTRTRPTHAGLAAVTGLVVDVLSMRNPSRRWYLTTRQIWLERWSLLQVEPLNDTERMLALAENLLDR